jgi:hypothetical protein
MVIGSANLVHLHVGGLAPWVTTLDGRLKEIIRFTPVGLNFVRQLKPKAYTMKASCDVRLGIIAQDLEEGAPNFQGMTQLLNTKHKTQNPTEYCALNCEAFVAPLVKSIQDRDACLKSLELIRLEGAKAVAFNQSKDHHFDWALQIIEGLMALNVLIFVFLKFKC